jgi:hypothetical protein
MQWSECWSHSAHPGRRGRRIERFSPAALWMRAASLLLTVAFVAPIVHPQSGESGEYEVKAAFLFNFAKFVQWPSASFSGPQSDFDICLFGDDPFGKSIDDVLRGKVVGDHPVAINRCKSFSEIGHCQIVFVSLSEGKHLSQILAALKGTNTLVVGESDGFATSGGMIQFTLEQQRVRFIINVDAAENAGLQISSKLLALAKVVRDNSVCGKS